MILALIYILRMIWMENRLVCVFQQSRLNGARMLTEVFVVPLPLNTIPFTLNRITCSLDADGYFQQNVIYRSPVI